MLEAPAAASARPLAMLELRALHVHYGLSHVLQGVDVELHRGEVVGLFGRNGVGKTTVLKAVAGWVAPSDGGIFLDGCPLRGLPADAVARSGLGFVPEDRRIFPGLTVEENLRLGFRQRPGRAKAQARAQLEKMYARFPRLAERRRQLGTTLSGGEQQMLAIARVLVGEPRLLLIDEPTEGLAPMIVDEIFALLVQLRSEGVPILLVEQNITRALEVADRFYALERGRVVLCGSAASSEERERLVQAITV